ncbi:PIN domain-containing protein [Kumtagia ephedrae]|uniref:PIN domain-containing protein n=1 Tax=Kumtagia ephedrae TaxID=2116701 RepID=A0A2P7STH8_9HYPH|nr:type II toxin-antitoxin system VapC family toxin [Mesorhizobium ephedrae]PSJ65774.1 PIN domain-containing protein [Mesorhizobium ephedrae]
MTVRVLDSSVILAIVFGERGREEAVRLSRGALISSVNVGEIVTKCLEKAESEQAALDYMKNSNIIVVGFDFDDARLAGQLSARTPKGVLSLGDRACLVTAIRAGAAAVTADRIWAQLDLPCPVELIR